MLGKDKTNVNVECEQLYNKKNHSAKKINPASQYTHMQTEGLLSCWEWLPTS